MAKHRYWRLYPTVCPYYSNNHFIAQFRMAVAAGAPNLAVAGNGTASASLATLGAATNAFNESAANGWGPAEPGQWLQWDFGVGNEADIVEVKIGNTALDDNHVTAADIKYSDNGTLWVKLMSAAGSSVNSALTTTLYVPPSAITVDASPPMMSIISELGAGIQADIPNMQIDFGAGVQVDVSLPTQAITADFGISVSVQSPNMTLGAMGHDSSGENYIVGSVPMVGIQTDFGSQTTGVVPMAGIGADMTVTALVRVELAITSMSLDSTLGGEPYEVAAEFRVPMMQVAAQFGVQGKLDLPMMKAESHIRAGGLASVVVNIPMVSLEAQTTQQSHGSILLVIPMMVPMYGLTADFAIPMMQLDAHIKAVVSVTYEAYSVNLTHTAEAPTDEVTRYTNYPFDQIVRLGANYYGVATDGLYLLGGKLDNAQPIAYTVKTCIDDFKAKEFKNIASGYFGGRIGPDMKVTVFAGEQGDESYDYSTPRGQGAQNHREKFGRGVKNRYYAIGVSGEEELVLDNIELEINKMTRRI